MGMWESDPTVTTLKKLSVLEEVDDEEIERVKGIMSSNAVSYRLLLPIPSR